jgi:hypothetical protein
MPGEQRTESTKRIGRLVGALFLIQALLAIPTYTEVGMMRSVIQKDFLVNAAASAAQIRIALLLTFLLSAMTLAAALVVFPVIRRQSERMAHLFLALSVVGLAAQVVEFVATRNMVTMSVMYHAPNAAKPLLEALATVARSSWSSSHFTNLLLGHIKAFVFFLIVFRFAFVPRWLAGAGIATTLLSMTAATLPLLGYPFSYWMIAPTGVTQLVFTIWLLIRGFRESSENSVNAGADPVTS